MRRDAHVTLNSGGKGSVVIGDVDISSHVLGVQIEAVACDRTRVSVDLFVDTVEVDGEVQVRLPQDTVDALVALGWTPPTDEVSCTGPGCGYCNEETVA